MLVTVKDHSSDTKLYESFPIHPMEPTPIVGGQLTEEWINWMKSLVKYPEFDGEYERLHIVWILEREHPIEFKVATMREFVDQLYSSLIREMLKDARCCVN